MSRRWLEPVETFASSRSCDGIHLFDYASEMKPRDKEGNVSCRCAKCGKVFTVKYGIALGVYGRLIPLYQYGIMFA